MPTPDRTRAARRRAGAITAAATLLAVPAGCDDDSDLRATRATAATAPATRPSVTIAVDDDEITVPTEIPAGIVDVTITAAGTRPHHIQFLRLNDGVTNDELLAAPPGTAVELMTLRGGRPFLAPGDTATITLDLRPGDYQINDVPEGELVAQALVTVAEGDTTAPAAAPAEDGTVSLGDDTITLPDDVDGSGTFRIENTDDVLHEALVVRLADGNTVDDLRQWAATNAGPPPGEPIGGFGLLSPGVAGWLPLELEPGTYAFACFVPGPDGTPHAAHGMVAGFEIT